MATVSPPGEAPPGPWGTLLVAALTIAFAGQLAYWTWVFAAPPAVGTAPERKQGVDLAAVARLFGASPPASQASAPSGASLRLKGVIAPTPGVGASAIFSTGAGRDIAVFVEGELTPGVKLVEVNPDHAVLSRGGVRERIDLDARRAQGAAPAPSGRAGGFRVNVASTGANNFTFSRKELDDALRDPAQLNYLGQIGMPHGGGVRMEQAPAGSLAQKLGLQPGDVIRKVNGQAVASTGDLARLYTQFNTLSGIQAEVQRGSNTVQLSYSIQP